ncbi:MAG: aldo/keto reductase [Dysgonamonadaceae bacterium]|nr:aldo/keto reductase [Dysgonamonadaceae bacterium]MDD4728912.1 aldo/keto reductase [Dysgonamonadaceae bacterium]
MKYSYCGLSGLQLPVISLGLWHNFGFNDNFDEAKKMICYAFEKGVTHFDLANNYGPPPGSSETNFGKILKENLDSHRDEIIISSKAGHLMWPGPYGDGSSRKNLMASINQSLKRTGLEYFDIFYSHRYDGVTPVEETMQALIDIVKQGKALYIGISKYPPEEAKQAMSFLRKQHVPCLIFQDKYSMLHRKPEEEIFDIVEKEQTGFIGFSPLAQGLLSDKYLNEIPPTSRAANPDGFLKREEVTQKIVSIVRQLNIIANERQQSLAQMALAWVLRRDVVTSVIVGTSSIEQLQNNLKTIDNISFNDNELKRIDSILEGAAQ